MPRARVDGLYQRISATLELARAGATRAVNVAMVVAYWDVGRQLAEEELEGETRAEYGATVVAEVSSRLRKRLGPGFGPSNLWRMKQFYEAFPTGSYVRDSRVLSSRSPGPEIVAAVRRQSAEFAPFPSNLSWTHYRRLLSVSPTNARAFYELEAARSGWSTRELERQVGSMLFERLASTRDAAGVAALGSEGVAVASPTDVIKDPFVLEFLELQERPQWRESDLEQAIIEGLEAFLLELGKGFCFVARQHRMSLDGDHFFVDLVFYHRLLRCFVLIDLKLGKLGHHDLGQMQMYVNYFDRFEREAGEAKTVGIVLCSDKNDAVVEITLPEDNEQVLTARYQLHLPTKEQLQKTVESKRRAVEELIRRAEE